MKEILLSDRPTHWHKPEERPIQISGLVALLSEAARELAKKGMAAGLPIAGPAGCSLTVISKRFGLEARIGFSPTGNGEFRWLYIVVSDNTPMVCESGKVSSFDEAANRLQGFASVISTIASFHYSQ